MKSIHQEQMMQSAAEIDNLERRGTRRHKVFKGAVLRFNKGYSVIDAVIKNESDKGAMLMMGETTGVPSDFELVVADKKVVNAHIVWRQPARLGIAFSR